MLDFFENKNKKRVSRNVEIKGKYKNKRCFIIGNGPSLNSLDFSLLSNEYVFTVNWLMLHESFPRLQSNFHVCFDGAAFGYRKDVKHNTSFNNKCFRMLDKRTQLFVPSEAYGYLHQRRLDAGRKVYYFDVDGKFDYRKKIELARKCPPFTTVIQYAILIAIYMGFSEIYLLGCDATFWMSTFSEKLGEEEKEWHAYKEEKNENSSNNILIRKQLVKASCEDLLYDAYLVMKGYRELNSLANKNGIILKNLSPVSLIDSIPRDSIENILRR